MVMTATDRTTPRLSSRNSELQMEDQKKPGFANARALCRQNLLVGDERELGIELVDFYLGEFAQFRMDGRLTRGGVSSLCIEAYLD